MTNSEKNQIESTERREVLASLVKYSAALGGASTVVLSASEAVAWSGTSGHVSKDQYFADHYEKKKEFLENVQNHLNENPEKKAEVESFFANLGNFFKKLFG